MANTNVPESFASSVKKSFHDLPLIVRVVLPVIGVTILIAIVWHAIDTHRQERFYAARSTTIDFLCQRIGNFRDDCRGCASDRFDAHSDCTSSCTGSSCMKKCLDGEMTNVEACVGVKRAAEERRKDPVSVGCTQMGFAYDDDVCHGCMNEKLPVGMSCANACSDKSENSDCMKLCTQNLSGEVRSCVNEKRPPAPKPDATAMYLGQLERNCKEDSGHDKDRCLNRCFGRRADEDGSCSARCMQEFESTVQNCMGAAMLKH